MFILIFYVPILVTLTLKSEPIVGSYVFVNSSFVNHFATAVLPTPPSPINIAFSFLGSICLIGF